MNKKSPIKEPTDSLTGVVSTTEMTGLEPTPPKSESEAESYNTLAGVPFADCSAQACRDGTCRDNSRRK